MNEIEKLYKNAGICKIKTKKCTTTEYLDCENWQCVSCNKYVAEYPPFTAEKQIELIKWCIDNYRGEISDTIETEWLFKEQLSAHINNLWQDLTEEEKQQVKGILE